MEDRNCTSCSRLISEHILCSYDKVTRYCPGGPGPSKEEELETIKKLFAVFEKLGIQFMSQGINCTPSKIIQWFTDSEKCLMHSNTAPVEVLQINLSNDQIDELIKKGKKKF